MKTFRDPPDVFPPLAAYTHQVELSGDERLLALSGQVGIDTEGNVPDDPIAQLELALENVGRNLVAAGMDWGDLVKLTLYFVGEVDAERRRAAISAKLGDHRPCMTLLYVASLATPAFKVELDAWASRSPG
ncbi:MAG TPA: RidA family protein [Gaiellaceae bacterium]